MVVEVSVDIGEALQGPELLIVEGSWGILKSGYGSRLARYSK